MNPLLLQMLLGVPLFHFYRMLRPAPDYLQWFVAGVVAGAVQQTPTRDAQAVARELQRWGAERCP